MKNTTNKKPDFIIAGCTRCGSTSIFNYLNQHPLIHMSKVKEIDFFNLEYRYRKGLNFYLSFWDNQQIGTRYPSDKVLYGEASPNYMHIKEVPARIKQMIPNVKLIFILRDPVKRAYSHYLQKFFYGIEKYSFTRALMEEENRITKNTTCLFDYSYKFKGEYITHLNNFSKYFKKEEILVLFSEYFLKTQRGN